MSEMDTGQVAADVAPPAIESVADAPENLFADETAELTEHADTETQDDVVKAQEPEATEETQDQRALFDKLKAQYEPDSPNMQALAAQVKDFKAKIETLKPFEPLVAIPEVAQAVQSLTTGVVTGQDAWKAVESIALPGTIESLKEEALWHYVDNPANQDAIARSLLGNHMSADVLKKVAAAVDPVKGYMTVEDLLDQIQERPDNTLSDSELEERQAWKAEQAAARADREAIATQRQQYEAQQEHAAVMQAATEVFTHTDAPLDEIEAAYGFVSSEKDPPEIKSLKEDAREIYRARAERLLIKDTEAQNHVKNIQAMLKQGSKQKDRAMSMYGPSLQDRTRALATQAARSTNQFIKARLAEIKVGLGKAQLAPNEVGSLAATGGHVADEMSREDRARAVFNQHMSTPR